MKLLKSLAIALTCLAAASAFSKQFELAAKIVHVDDGDTVIALTADKTQMKVRLANIDAPESSHTNKEKGRIGQPYNNNSTKFLAGMVKGKDVDLRCFDEDRYGRSVCEIFVGGKSANQAMVRQGWAWANVSNRGRYLRDKSLIDTERQARSEAIGLWAAANPVAPWEWRDRCWKQNDCSQ